MIKTLTIDSFILHHKKTFDFVKGLNSIGGPNEAGKSLILEAICFALFGSQALRRKVSTYPKDTSVSLDLVIKGKEYKVLRSLNSATLTSGEGQLLASSTTVVNMEITKLLGYDFKVFKVANMAAQSEINYLSVLKPEERKRMIENVLGLSATEIVINNHKNLLRERKAAYASWINAEPVIPELPQPCLFSEALETKMREQLKDCQQDLGKRKQTVERIRSLKQTLAHLDSKIAGVQLGERPCKLSQHEVIQAIGELNNAEVQKQLWHDNSAKKRNEIERLTTAFDPELLTVGSAELAHHWDLYNLSQQKKRFIADGSVTCPNCATEVYLAQDTLKDFKHIPDDVVKPEYTLTQIEKNIHVKEQIEQATREFNNLQLDLGNINVTLTGLAEKYPTLEVLRATAEWDRNSETHQGLFADRESAIKQLAELPDLEQAIQHIIGLETTVDATEKQLLENQILRTAQTQYDRAIKRLADWDKERILLGSLKEKEELRIKTLTILKESIKADIIPRINAVASTWVRKLSDGKHSSVTLTDNMEILMNDVEVDAYSGSGKALCHLSLRMALAQVLTKGVLPIFMADEVDASMTPERSMDVLNTLKEMLQSTVEQVILISHRKLDLSLNSDNHIQL